MSYFQFVIINGWVSKSVRNQTVKIGTDIRKQFPKLIVEVIVTLSTDFCWNRKTKLSRYILKFLNTLGSKPPVDRERITCTRLNMQACGNSLLKLPWNSVATSNIPVKFKRQTNFIYTKKTYAWRNLALKPPCNSVPTCITQVKLNRETNFVHIKKRMHGNLQHVCP